MALEHIPIGINHQGAVKTTLRCSACRWKCRLSSGWEARETRGRELPTLGWQRARRLVMLARWMHTERHSRNLLVSKEIKSGDSSEVDGHREGGRSRRLRRRSETFPHWDCEGTKPLPGVSPQGHQLELFLCCCARNKWLYGHVRLCCGQPGVEPARKPGLAVWGGCAGRPAGPARSLGLPHSCGNVALGVRLPEPREWAHGEVSSAGRVGKDYPAYCTAKGQKHLPSFEDKQYCSTYYKFFFTPW